jgi:GT2 family glycosyltransferase
MPKGLTAAIIIPTHRRVGYLDRELATIVPQARAHKAEVIVVDDADDPETKALAARHDVRYLLREGTPGPNAARNTAIAQTKAELLCLLDDDIEADADWLTALLKAGSELPPEVGVLAGKIRPRLVGHRFRSCGREGAPITDLLGDEDRDVERGWGANMAIRRSAIDQIGDLDERLGAGVGDEEEWQQRWLDHGGRIRYIAGAAVDHMRRGDDARLRTLCRAAFHRGKAGRRYDNLRGELPTLSSELRTLVACVAHGPLHLCFNGPVMTAHSLGRIAEARKPTPLPALAGVDDFLSGQSGAVGGRRDLLRRLADARLDVRTLVMRWRLRRRAAKSPQTMRVLVAGIERTEIPNTVAAIRAELARSRHELEIDIRPLGTGGKFDNINAILADHDLDDFDYLLMVDDDIDLPHGFVDTLIHCADRGALAIAQPAHRLRSHAAWPVTRRTAAAWRETNFVEIGPATLFSKTAFSELLPFPKDLRMGWGLDAHWGAVARERGWQIGVIDAAAVGHTLRAVAANYAREDAVADGRRFLAERPYVARDQVRTLASHR